MCVIPFIQLACRVRSYMLMRYVHLLAIYVLIPPPGEQPHMIKRPVDPGLEGFPLSVSFGLRNSNTCGFRVRCQNMVFTGKAPHGEQVLAAQDCAR